MHVIPATLPCCVMQAFPVPVAASQSPDLVWDVGVLLGAGSRPADRDRGSRLNLSALRDGCQRSWRPACHTHCWMCDTGTVVSVHTGQALASDAAW